jgi:hypothetical protein
MSTQDNIQTIETEHPEFNGSSKCNNCGETLYWNGGVINRSTKRKMPLAEPYKPSSGVPPKRHLCMGSGTSTGQWINKAASSDLKKTWCDFCKRYYDLSHWWIYVNKKWGVKRPYLLCEQAIKIGNHGEYFEPLTDGWFRP